VFELHSFSEAELDPHHPTVVYVSGDKRGAAIKQATREGRISQLNHQPSSSMSHDIIATLID
jgi:hypothetical protein